MSLNRFLQDLASTVAGGAERRFARDLARTLGFRVEEPEHGKKPNASPVRATPTPVAPAPPTAPPHVDPQSPAFAAGVAAGRAWGFSKAYRSDLERLAQWAVTVGERFTGRDVAAAPQSLKRLRGHYKPAFPPECNVAKAILTEPP
jgi:hypothetical protein